MTSHLLLVLSNATEGGDEAFNSWYTNTHLGDVLKLKGFVGAQRFAYSSTQLAEGDPAYKYLAIYEVETDDLATAAAALSGGAGTMEIDPTLDRARTVAWFYTPSTPRVTA